MYRRHLTNKRYEVSECSDCDEKKPDKNFYKFYTEQRRMKSRSSSEKLSPKTCTGPSSTRNAYFDRKNIGNAYSERNVKKPSSTRAKRKLKEELKAKKYNSDQKSKNNDFFSSEVSTFIENILQREAFDFNYEELHLLEEKLVDETQKAQIKLKIQSSDEDIIRKVFPITNQISEIKMFKDEKDKENVVVEKFVMNDFLDMIWPRFNELLNQTEADKAKLRQIKDFETKKLYKNYFPNASLKSVLPEILNLEPDIIPNLIVNNVIEAIKKSSDSGFDDNNTAGEPNLKKSLEKNNSKLQFTAFEKDLVSGGKDEKTKLRKSSTPFKKMEKLNLKEDKIIVPENMRFRRNFLVCSIFQVILCVVMVVCLKLLDIIYSPT